MRTPPRPNRLLSYGQHFIDDDDVAAVTEVLRHAPLTQGPKIAEFEKAVAAYVGSRYAVAVTSGTAALHLSCLAAGLKPGDKLLTTPNTFVASANCALYVGAAPVFSDIDPVTLNLAVPAVEKVLQENDVRALIPVHFAGLPCDMPRLRQAAAKANTIVIEDACHALGSNDPDGGRVGNGRYSEMTTFSFHPVKAIAAGEGGMIVTNREDLYQKLLSLRTHGITKDAQKLLFRERGYTDVQLNPWYYEMQELGYNYRMTDIQAALALSQLKKIDRFIARRKEIAKRYDKAFSNHPFIKPAQTDENSLSAHHLYPVRIDFQAASKTREKLMRELRDAGIACQVHYIPVHYHPYYQRLGWKTGQFPAAEAYYDQALSLPIFYSLSDDEQDYVIETMTSLLR